MSLARSIFKTSSKPFKPTYPYPIAPLELETFGRLTPWATSRLRDDSTVSVLIRNHEHQPYKIQSSLLAHISNTKTAYSRVRRSSDTQDLELDLTRFEPPAPLIFLFWLYNRRLPHAKRDTSPVLMKPPSSPASRNYPQILNSAETEQLREIQETFNLALIEAWRLGASLSAPRFQNEVLLRAAVLLEREELGASKGADPYYSSAVSWARRAFDATVEMREVGREMRDFAVDVAAKRVYDVGMSGLTLTPSERLNLSTCEQFAGEVFGSLGGQIGTTGVRISDFAKAYLVEDGSA